MKHQLPISSFLSPWHHHHPISCQRIIFWVKQSQIGWKPTSFLNFVPLNEEIKNELLLTCSVQCCCLFLEAQDTRRGQFQNRAALTYLDNIRRLVYVFFKDQDGGGIDIDIVLPRHLLCPSQTHVHVSEWQVIFVCKSSQLLGSQTEEEIKLVAGSHKPSVTSSHQWWRAMLACIAPLGLPDLCALGGIPRCSTPKNCTHKAKHSEFYFFFTDGEKYSFYWDLRWAWSVWGITSITEDGSDCVRG